AMALLLQRPPRPPSMRRLALSDGLRWLLPSLAWSLVALALATCGPSQNGRTHDTEYKPPDMAVKPGTDPEGDYDHDGFKVKDGDCNDLDPKTYPGAPEICGDHVDQDCNKAIDEYCDDDADGYNVWEDKNRPGGDCDDIDPNINPG